MWIPIVLIIWSGVPEWHILPPPVRPYPDRESCYQAIETAKRLHANDNIQFVHGNAQNVPIKSGVADIVIINETHMAEFENISEEDAKVFSEVKRLLKPMIDINQSIF